MAKKPSDSKIVVAGALALALGIAGVILVQPPLKSTRSPSMGGAIKPHVAEGVVQARLWEDPLESARRAATFDGEAKRTIGAAKNDVDRVGACSFRPQGGLWPPHCVARTAGAAFSASLDLPAGAQVISKADTSSKDAYSGFEGTPLNTQLQSAGIRRVFVGGLATDYCVLNTMKDALRYGYTTFVAVDAVRAVNVQLGDGERAMEEMLRLGAATISLEEIEA